MKKLMMAIFLTLALAHTSSAQSFGGSQAGQQLTTSPMFGLWQVDNTIRWAIPGEWDAPRRGFRSVGTRSKKIRRQVLTKGRKTVNRCRHGSLGDK